MERKKSLRNVKLAFLFGVGVLIILTLYFHFKNEPIDDEGGNEIPNEGELIEGVDELDIDEVEKKYRKSQGDEGKSEDKEDEEGTLEVSDSDENIDDYDLSNVYQEKFGKDNISNVEDISNKVVHLFIEGEESFDRWKDYASKKVYKKIQEEVSVGDGVVREVKDMDLNYVKADSDEEIKVEVDLSWYLVVEDNPVDVSGNLIYLTFDLSKTDLKVVDIIFV